MTLSEWVRREAFWGLDAIRGSKIRNHYKDVQNIHENCDDPDVARKHADYLQFILDYAVHYVPYYSKIEPDGSLNSFPVVNKNIIRNNFKAFQSIQFKESGIIKMHTSGSTGTPFTVWHDRNKRDRVYAEMIYLWGKAGYQVGMRYLFLKMQPSLSRLTAWARNVLLYSALNQDEEKLEDIRQLLKADLKVQMILCYPSILGNLASYLTACGDTPEMFNIKTIIGFGESFPEKAQLRLKGIFDCNVVSLYSNQENGMLALECAGNKEFHINSASYHIELLKNESNDPVAVGEPGRIVVTDLFNHAMPLIRYDTGDIGVWKKEADCDWKSQVFSSVDGQKTDFIFDTRGKRLSPHIVSIILEPFDRLLQFQFIQEDAKKYLLKLNDAGDREADASIVLAFKNLLGEDAVVVIEHVHEIPVLSSGKRKEVVCNYQK